MKADVHSEIKDVPLVVDLDGTLIRNDLTADMLLLALFSFPIQTLILLFKFLGHKPTLKAKLYELCQEKINVEALPYNATVLTLLKDQALKGRDIILCSGSHAPLVKKIAAKFSFISEAFGTEDRVNLTSDRKARFLTEKYATGFDYIGNSKDDIAVWNASRRAYSVNTPNGVRNRFEKQGRTLENVEQSGSAFKGILKAMRLHQWVKNSLIFMVPILTVERLSLSDIPTLVLGFIAFGLLASGTYILNDLTDISNDRAHHTKQKRPFANGSVSVFKGLLSGGAMIASAFAMSIFVNVYFALVLGVYFCVTLLYSFYLKRLAIIDIITLANLFLIRVAAGAAIVIEPLSAWLACFVLTFFLSLSLVKRYAEVKNSEGGPVSAISGRGYTSEDANIILSFGVMTVGMTLLFFVLYSLIVENPAFASWESLLLVGTVLTYWIMRIWLLAYRGQMNEDPVLFAVKDPVSIICGFCIVAAILTEKIIGLL